MAENYLEFSEAIDKLTPEEVEWLEESLTAPEDEAKRPAWLAKFGFKLDDPDDDFESWPGFGWEVEAEGVGKTTSSLWINKTTR